LFAEYQEDYNTGTLPHVKYYDIDKWQQSGGDGPGKVSAEDKILSDEDRVRKERQREIEDQRKRLDSERVRVMMESLKESGEEKWKERRVKELTAVAPTRESIAKDREREKKEAELKAKRKWK